MYENGLSSWAISKQMRIDHKSILNYLNKSKTNIRNKSEAAKLGVKEGRIIIKRNIIPLNLRLNKDLSYILGVLAGDGYLTYNNKLRRYQIGLNATDKKFVNEFKKSLISFFQITPTNEFKKSKKVNWNDQYATRLCSKEACDYINSIGEFRKENWTVPKIIKESDEDVKCTFIKGFFDSEGEIDKQIGRVGATSMNLEGLKEIQELLNDLKIRSTIILVKDLRPNTSQKYRLRINDKKSIILFNDLIGFTIQRKQQILDQFVNNHRREAVLFPRDRDRLTP